MSTTTLIQQLKSNPSVLGIVRYGRREIGDETPGGDFDLYVILREYDGALESLHFRWEDLPVDLNLRSLSDLERNEIEDPFDLVLSEGEVVYDAIGDMTERISRAASRWDKGPLPLSDGQRHTTRFGHRHVLDKVEGRLDSDTTRSHFLLATNIYWLIQTYFRVRCLPDRGETRSLAYLGEYEPDIYFDIAAFYEEQDLAAKVAITRRLTDAILEPVGGPLKDGEVLAFPRNAKENIDALANSTLTSLLSDQT